MSQTFEFYSARAAEASRQASEAGLDNVRDRHLRAEKTWLGLAEQARKVVENRMKNADERALRDDNGDPAGFAKNA